MKIYKRLYKSLQKQPFRQSEEMRKRFDVFRLVTVVVLLVSGIAGADQSARASDALSAQQRADALAAIVGNIEQFYVFPEKRAEISKALRDAQGAGRFDVDSPAIFAERITDELQRASHDSHLYVRSAPDWYAAAVAPAGEDSSSAAAYERMSALQDNHGLVEMKVLLGNVRYLRITGFSWIQDATGAVYDDAMRFLRDGAAIIIDLRGNGGGSSEATRYLVSHFMDEGVLLYTFLSQKEPTRLSHTLGYLPAGRIRGKPVYVLIDGRVRSAGEDVAYQVQQYRLGQLIGSKTVGAANNNDHIPVAPGFRFSLSVGRPVHPISKTNWEGVGVAPDLACPPEQALDRAYLAALTKLAGDRSATPMMAAEYAWAREGVEAKLQPRTGRAQRLDRLAGEYGEVKVELREGALWLIRPDRQPARLLLMRDDTYSVEDTEGLRVRLTGRALTLYMLGAPEPREYPRS